ncbi:hypothetical protein GMORB2_1036 [Geosmithia morbida]|uniref:DNA/RNA-binding protein Alba-like domain-containing protein n=1 Tax=Geosmithia morbida TaxID=1094350 RepID=A0A9P4YZI1_9HYPO|nr:uncharacterized protein GMORB2_1036 [Geosmithia morbida]KAF4125790.1 hypothetical protein GMORB2_1036 [Geosmithia morbida]
MAEPPIPKKRKQATDAKTTASPQAKKPRPQQNPTLSAPHEAIAAELSSKYDILTASVISSTEIRKRVIYATGHILQPRTDSSSDGAVSDRSRTRSRVVLLHSRPAEACKLITIVEQCKRVLKAQGRPWFQYNQLFELPSDDGAAKKKRMKKRVDVVEGTVLDGAKQDKGDGDDEEQDGEDEDEDDYFESMQTRFENAVLPQRSGRAVKSMRVFLSAGAVPELRAKDGVTVQTSTGA